MAKPPGVLDIKAPDRVELERRAQSSSAPARMAQRAQIVLLSAEGHTRAEIAGRIGCSQPTVALWQRRYAEQGLAGLEDRPRAGRPPTIDQAKRSEILRRSLSPPPPELGITHWSSRDLARQVGVHHSTIARLWREYGIQPRRRGIFTFRVDPELEAKVHGVLGLYLHRSQNAVALQAHDQPPIPPGARCVPTDLTALRTALEQAASKAANASGRQQNGEFPTFLHQVAEACPHTELHVVGDHDTSPRDPEIAALLAHDPRITFHYTSTASWLNLIEVFFHISSSQSVPDLVAATRRFVDFYAKSGESFVWIAECQQPRQS